MRPPSQATNTRSSFSVLPSLIHDDHNIHSDAQGHTAPHFEFTNKCNRRVETSTALESCPSLATHEFPTPQQPQSHVQSLRNIAVASPSLSLGSLSLSNYMPIDITISPYTSFDGLNGNPQPGPVPTPRQPPTTSSSICFSPVPTLPASPMPQYPGYVALEGFYCPTPSHQTIFQPQYLEYATFRASHEPGMSISSPAYLAAVGYESTSDTADQQTTSSALVDQADPFGFYGERPEPQ